MPSIVQIKLIVKFLAHKKVYDILIKYLFYMSICALYFVQYFKFFYLLFCSDHKNYYKLYSLLYYFK